MHQIHLLSTGKSLRLDYVLREIERRISGIRFTENDDHIHSDDTPLVISYGLSSESADLYVPRHPLISERARLAEFETRGRGADSKPFAMAGSEHKAARQSLDFDLFSAIFFLLSRVEEYNNPSQKEDRHGRYKPEHSWAYRYENLEIPLIDKWCADLAATLGIPHEKKGDTSVQLTFDVDRPWHTQNIPTWRKLYRRAKSLLGRSAHPESGTINKSDPFDTFSAILSALKRNEKQGIWFFLLSTATRRDALLSHTHPAFQVLFRQLGTAHHVGIHPSYSTFLSARRTSKELNEFAKLLEQNKSIKKSSLKSRQHFLRFRLPETYRILESVGVSEEYSMGYAELPGYRNGTSFPSQWYDVEEERISEMLVFPLHVMDVTLREYCGFTTAEARPTIQHFSKMAEQYGGRPYLLWHNSFFAECGDLNAWWELFLETCK